jgi:hypothetical protein
MGVSVKMRLTIRCSELAIAKQKRVCQCSIRQGQMHDEAPDFVPAALTCCLTLRQPWSIWGNGSLR